MNARRIASWAVGTALVALSLVFPSWASGYLLRVGTLIVIFAIFSTGLDLILGYCGLISFGHAAFFGVGAYITARLLVDSDVPFELIILIAIVASAALGALLGMTAWRVSGDYFALVTLGFGEIVHLVLVNWISVTRGPAGIPGIPFPRLFGISLQTTKDVYFLCLAILLVVLFVSRKLTRSYFGRALLTVREDQIVARSHGIQVPLVKVVVFAIGCGIAGLAGVLQAVFLSFVGPESFTLTQSILAVEIVIIGGMATTWGPLIGSVVLIGATEKLRSIAEWRSAIFGLVMVVILMVRPDGLAGLLGLTDRRRGRPANAVWRLLGKADSTPAADGRNP